ncbi:MAG: response regulator [Myxococcales bacterium]
MIRVCIVENEALVREGLRRVLELDSEIEVTGEACDAEHALAVLRAARPDVVMLDMRMPRGGGLRVLEELERDPSPPPCLVLTTFDDADALLAAARAGAKGYLLKDVTADELGQAIRCLARGGTWFKPSLTEGVLRGLGSLGDGVGTPWVPERTAWNGGPYRHPVDEPLTQREREVVRMMAGGYSNREIGSALGVAERTVKNHVSSILAKLGVRDRTRAVLKALEKRLF